MSPDEDQASQRETMIVDLFLLQQLTEAIENLLAMLTEQHARQKRPFNPAKTGQPWTALLLANHCINSYRAILKMTPGETAAEATAIIHRRAQQAPRRKP